MAGKEQRRQQLRGRKNIFVSVGTHPEQFDRLLMAIDGMAGRGIFGGRVFAQTGHSNYVPKNFEFRNFLPIMRFHDELKGCDAFITHAGEGNIGLAKNLGRKFICVPRRKEFAEHTNDHQLELAQVVEQKGLGLVAWDTAELESRFLALEKFVPARVPRGNIAGLLESYVKGELKW